MPRYSVPLSANVPARVPYPGKLFQLVGTGGPSTITLGVEWTDQTNVENIGAIEQYFRLYSAADKFTGLELTSTVDTVADILVSNHDMSVNRSDGSTVSVTGTATTQEIQATGASPIAAVAASSVIALVVAANPARREVRFGNIGANPVAIGTAALTWAKRVIVLNPGDVWTETRGAALAWYAITDAGMAASVTAQELTA